ncbi:hypothetical protein OUZ56_033404 [Daphnia magna]|uniref:Uncharacterized protein n=1 Tax=Daphnia magna TaxID=35525 RepID=A0ABR0BB02_9CRUS|nr:hypothetical protein OUZ56_033404 [Daphnia magna]
MKSSAHVRKGSHSRDGIKRCPDSALEESPSGELPELGSVGVVPWSLQTSPSLCIHIEYKYIPCSLHVEVKTHEVKLMITVYSHEYKYIHAFTYEVKLMSKTHEVKTSWYNSVFTLNKCIHIYIIIVHK